MERKSIGTQTLNTTLPGFFPSENINVKFGEAPFTVLLDSLTDLNSKNKQRLENVSNCWGVFKDSPVAESILLICEELQQDPLVGYQALEILDRFMIKHLENLLSCQHVGDTTKGDGRSHEETVLETLRDKSTLLVFSCIQLASKLTHHLSSIDNNRAVAFLKSIGHSCSKETLLESEVVILKTLDFSINFPNPLIYVETLLEVLDYNAAIVPAAHLYCLCQRVLQFVCLQRTAIYESLLVAVTACPSPSQEQSRASFVCVKEDYMLLSVGVIAVAAFIHNFVTWEKVVEELSHITGISPQSIRDFASVTMLHVVKSETPFKTT
ncbi:cyclin N-terminal domain-containing protein 1 [Arapaima gigas]